MLDDEVVLFNQFLLLAKALDVDIALLDLLDPLKDVLAFVNVHQAELLEVNFTGLIVVDSVVHVFEVLNCQVDTGELAACDEFLKAKGSIKVDIEVTECSPIVSEFLLDTLMNTA